jgi:hypothetical protein
MAATPGPLGIASQPGQWSDRSGAVPRWMAWAPPAALVWALACGSVRVWWAVAGAPSFGRSAPT